MGIELESTALVAGALPAAYYQNVMHYSAYRGISIECDILRSIFRAAPWSKCWKKKHRNAAEFLGSILHHANSFSML